jgi:hypothetical protein
MQHEDEDDGDTFDGIDSALAFHRALVAGQSRSYPLCAHLLAST